MPVGDRRHLSQGHDERVGEPSSEAAEAPRARHQRRTGAAASRPLALGRFGQAGVRKVSLQVLVQQDVARLDVTVHDVRRARVQVDERVDGLVHDAQPLPPRQRLGLEHKPEAAEASAAFLVSRPQPVLQRPTPHQRKDEAGSLQVEAVAE